MRTLFLILIHASFSLAKSNSDDIYKAQKDNDWFKDGVDLIKKNLKIKNINNKAKGVVLFLGDGMGISTVTAARIYEGQLKGNTGEENVLSWETFANVALSKTYNTDAQVSDSAGTATAFLSGVKSFRGAINVNDKIKRGDCPSDAKHKVLSILMMAEMAGMSTGVVTNMRITHATPAAAYAHSSDRNYENDGKLPKDLIGCHKDIARQLIEFPYGDGLEVAFGGGRREFLPHKDSKSKTEKDYGKRRDGRNLIKEWIGKTSKNSKYEYIENKKQLENLNPKNVDHVLGLFSPNHLNYSHYRETTYLDEPSLISMAKVAIEVLQKNPKGYFLLVEAGNIDWAHHANKAYHALKETVEFASAVKAVDSMTDPEDTLLIVTADHSHVFAIGGYQTRGNPILKLTDDKTFEDKFGKRFTTLGYLNGPSANKTRTEPTPKELEDPDYKYQSLVPLKWETHGGEDVAIYARGTQAHLFRGVVEQNYIFHVMDYALCLSDSKRAMCCAPKKKC